MGDGGGVGDGDETGGCTCIGGGGGSLACGCCGGGWRAVCCFVSACVCPCCCCRPEREGQQQEEVNNRKKKEKRQKRQRALRLHALASFFFRSWTLGSALAYLLVVCAISPAPLCASPLPVGGTTKAPSRAGRQLLFYNSFLVLVLYTRYSLL
jgi:hypothetical protein